MVKRYDEIYRIIDKVKEEKKTLKCISFQNLTKELCFSFFYYYFLFLFKKQFCYCFQQPDKIVILFTIKIH